MTDDPLAGLPARRGHFLLESGYHTDRWLTLDELFVDPAAVAPRIDALAERLRPHGPTAVCGPLLGGAFLAQALASALGVQFYFTEPASGSSKDTLFAASYRLPKVMSWRVKDRAIAVVDDVISAGSSVRATVAAVENAGGTVVAIGALAVLGDRGLKHFAERGLPVETLMTRELNSWTPEECPLCRSGQLLEDPARTDRAG